MNDQPRPGDIVVWDMDPENTLGHVHILTAKDARSYRWSARKLGWKRRARQIGRLIRGNR